MLKNFVALTMAAMILEEGDIFRHNCNDWRRKKCLIKSIDSNYHWKKKLVERICVGQEKISDFQTSAVSYWL